MTTVSETSLEHLETNCLEKVSQKSLVLTNNDKKDNLQNCSNYWSNYSSRCAGKNEIEVLSQNRQVAVLPITLLLFLYILCFFSILCDNRRNWLCVLCLFSSRWFVVCYRASEVRAKLHQEVFSENGKYTLHTWHIKCWWSLLRKQVTVHDFWSQYIWCV